MEKDMLQKPKRLRLEQLWYALKSWLFFKLLITESFQPMACIHFPGLVSSLFLPLFFVSQLFPSLVWHPYKNHTYYVGDTPTMNWGDARKVCQNVGGDLAIIKSLDENDFIRKLLLKQTTAPQRLAWIGLFRNGDNDLNWVDGTDYAIIPSFSPWDLHQPDNYGNCVLMTLEGLWHDVPCNVFDYLAIAPVIICQRSEHM